MMIIRTTDTPLHEFLPDLTDLSVKIALDGDNATGKDKALLAAVRRLHEQNPMLGLRGVRLGLVIPGLFDLQVRAIAEAAAIRKKAGGDPRVEIMVPLVAAVQELEIVREESEQVLAQVWQEQGVTVDGMLIGTMIEVPRAAVTAGQIAEVADFFSFGTNDLTQMGFGFSRDDIGKFLGMYEERKLVPANPFVTIDRPGIGRLMRIAADEGRAGNGSLHAGVCGEPRGHPARPGFFPQIR